MTVDVLLHASETAHVDSLVGILAGVAMFGAFLLAIKLLSARGPGGRRTE
jgi:uncharacterized membrane protein